jgi:hypothetical protein
MVKSKVSAAPVLPSVPEGFVHDVTFDLSDLSPSFSNTTGKLTLAMPAVSLDFAGIAEQVRGLGLEDSELEPLIYDFAHEIRVRVVSKLFAQRML